MKGMGKEVDGDRGDWDEGVFVGMGIRRMGMGDGDVIGVGIEKLG